MPGGYFAPRLDPIGQQRRIDETAPLVAAYLGGRPVVLARPDPRTRRPGEPADLTVPVTISRFRRALDIESGRATMRYEPSLIDDWPLTHMPIAGLSQDPGASQHPAVTVTGIVIGSVVGYALGHWLTPGGYVPGEAIGGIVGAVVGGWAASRVRGA